jgi:2-polyprenyl-3-methyl-5-hydroxy-6-metoxy-1,4-benzoquinol methylase
MSFPLRSRQVRPEIMDQPGLSPHLHDHALRGLQRINRWSGSSRIYWPCLYQAAQAVAPRPLRILDLATGGGDVPIRLWHRAKKRGVNMEIEGCDVSNTAIVHAQALAVSQSAPVRFFTLNVLTEEMPAGYDVFLCSLFLHHLEEQQAIALLQRMAASVGRLLLINDLMRSPMGYALAYVGTRLLTTSRIVHLDGPQSVAAAFTVQEMHQLAQQAGLVGANIRRAWPFRMLFCWSKS